MRIEIRSRPQRPILDTVGGTGGNFFLEVINLQKGKFVARIHVIFSNHAKDDIVTIGVHSLVRDRELAKVEVPSNGSVASDEIYISFEIYEPGDVMFTGHSSANCSTTLLRFITIVCESDRQSVREDFFSTLPRVPSIARLRCVTIGTTGVCNASCIHCPTNKRSRRMPQGRMSMELFTKLVDELANGSYQGKMVFGLFGEPLDDPFLLERLRLVKKKLPASEISIATNAGLFDEDRHAEVIDLADVIAVHVESVSPEIYNRLMDPLKADRVLPRISRLIALAQKKGRNNVTLTAPTHRENILDADRIRQFFEPAGNFGFEFTPISNRAWDAGPFSQMALATVGVGCHPSQILEQFFVDWDGAILPCCFDFSKSMVLGNLSEATITEVFAGPEWQGMFETFRRREWSSKTACAQCRADDDLAVGSMVTSLNKGTHSKVLRFDTTAFSVTPSGRRQENGTIASVPKSDDGCVVYGPYIRLQPGSYRIYNSINILGTGGATLLFDVCTRKSDRIATKYLDISSEGQVNGTVDFVHNSIDPHDLVEFRIWKFGDVTFTFRGATLVRLGDVPTGVGAPPVQVQPPEVDHPIRHRSKPGGMRKLWRILQS